MFFFRRKNGTIGNSTNRCRLATFEQCESRYLLTGNDSFAPVDDHGDNAAEATRIEIGVTAIGGIQFQADSDWFAFDAIEDETYLIAIDSPTTVVGAQVITEDGRTIASTDFSHVSFLATASATLFVKVDRQNLNPGFEYNLTIHRLRNVDRHGNDTTTATPIEVSSGFVTAGEIQTPEEQDWFAFEAVQGNTYHILANAFDSFDLELMEHDGSLTDFPSKISGLQSYFWTANDTGLVHLVAKWQPSRDDFHPGRYTLEVEVEGDDDHGETDRTATRLDLPNAGVGTITSNDRDWFSFTADVGETYVIKTDTSDTFLRLLDASGRLLRSSDKFAFEASIVWEPRASGTYFVEVSPTESAMQFDDFRKRYAVNVQRASDIDGYGDTLETATPIPIPSIIADAVEYPGESDWVSLQVEAGVVYEFFESISNILPGFRLTDESGSEILRHEFGESSVSFRALQDETLYLEILAHTSEFRVETPYQFLVRKQASQNTGDSMANATPIKANSMTRGVVDIGRSDWLTFTSRTGASHQPHLFFGQSFRLFTVDGIEISPNADGLYEPANTDRQLFIEVSGEGNYELYLSTFLDDYGNSQADATPIVDFANSPGAIQSEGDIDWFSFSAEEGVDYTIRADPRIPLELIDDEGTVIGVQDGLRPIRWLADTDANMFVRVANPPFMSLNYQVEITTDSDSGPIVAASDHVGSTPETAIPIEVFSNISHSIASTDDEDWFVFTAIAGETYYLSAGDAMERAPNGIGIEMDVFAADTTTKLASTLDDEASFAQANFEYALWTAPISGATYVRVTGTPNTDYTLALSTLDKVDVFGTGTGDATLIAEHDVPLQGVLDHTTDTDWFSFEALSGLTYTIETSGALSRISHLVDGVHQTLSDNNFSHVIRAGDTSRTVFIEVYPLLFGSAYELMMERATDDHADCAEEATPIALHSTIMANFETLGDTDWFALPVQRGVTYHLSAEGGEVWLVDADGETVLRRGRRPTNWTATADKTIFLRAAGFVESTVEFTITTLETVDDHGNSPSEATPAEVDSTLAGTIHGDYDRDWFSFQAERGTTYTVTESNGVRFQLFEEDGISFLGPNRFPEPSISWKAAFDGPVFLQVVDDLEFDYQFQLTSDRFGDDHGDRPETATPVTVPSSTTWQFDREQDVDWFSFEAMAGETYLVETRTFAGLLELMDPQGHIFRSKGEPSNGTVYNYIEWQADTSGTVLLSLTHPTSFPLAQERQLEVTTATASDDHGNSPQLATPILIGSLVEGEAHSTRDDDWFSFAARAGDSYELSTSSAVDLLLFGEDGSTLLDLGRDVSFVSAVEQTLYVNAKVRAPRTEYQFRLAASDDHGDTPEMATAAPVPSLTQGEINFGLDLDFISFQVHPSQTYLIETDEHDVHFRLTTADGSTLAVSESPFTGQPARIRWDADVAGEVFLEVRQGISSLASYDVRISAVDQIGDTPDTASPIVIPAEITGGIEFIDDVDWYSFAAEKDVAYVFEFGGSDPTVFSITNEVGTVLRSVTEIAGSIRWEAPTSEGYFIKVEGEGHAPVEKYNFRMTIDRPIFDVGLAIPRLREPRSSGEVSHPGEVNLFRFLGIEGETLHVETQLGSLTGSRISILDGNGQVLASDEQSSNGPGSTVEFVVPASGDVIVAVEGRGGAVGSYDLLLSTKIPGDLNNDRFINEADIDVLCAGTHSDHPNNHLDLNSDGIVDAGDIAFLVGEILGSEHGDANLDGRVNFADFLQLSSNFGESNASWAEGDFDCDGFVGFSDFLILSKQFSP